MQLRLQLNRAGDSLDEAVAALEKLNDSVDGYELWQEIENARVLVQEHATGRYSRSIALPQSVNIDEAEAHYENGILLLTLPFAVGAVWASRRATRGMD